MVDVLNVDAAIIIMAFMLVVILICASLYVRDMRDNERVVELEKKMAGGECTQEEISELMYYQQKRLGRIIWRLPFLIWGGVIPILCPVYTV